MIRKQKWLLPLVIWGSFAASNLTAQIIDSKTSQHILFPDARLTVNGLAWFNEEKPSLRRLPTRLKATFREPVWSLAQSPSGGRIRFRTDSKIVGIIAKSPNNSLSANLTTISQSGFDLYSNNEYIGSAWPNATNAIVKEWTLGKDRAMRDVSIYLPLYKSVTIEEIVLEKDAKIEPPGPFTVSKPVLYYGSSITQGAAASNPGNAFEAIVSRWLNVDFINLGFSGNGLGEPAVAQALSEIDASCIVLDYWANPKPDIYKQTLPGFVDILRKKYPTTPIIVTGPYYNSSETIGNQAGKEQVEKRKIAREFVESRQKAGDKNIYHVDGLEMISREHADALIDGRHANATGFYFCAKGLEPYLRNALNLPPEKK